MPSHLLVVPNVWGTMSTVSVRDTGALLLDDLLDVGFAGVFFRRLRMEVVMGVSPRSRYDALRHRYLAGVVKDLDRGIHTTVFVGTHPSDADLLDFESVRVVKFSDHALRELSKGVYGDGMMLGIEYATVLEVLSGSVDVWDTVRSWSDLPLLLVREYPEMVSVTIQFASWQQREMLGALCASESMPRVWMEDEIRLDFPTGRGFMVADYDYLGAVRPVWRDAVVRCLGRAPSVERVFRLPWFVVDVQAFKALCFRADINGLPAVSMHGESLVAYARDRLSSLFTSRELVGTWIGSMLSDDATVVEALEAMGVESIAPKGESRQLPKTGAPSIMTVPSEFAWMYETVMGCQQATWPGTRSVGHEPVVTVVPDGWAPSLRLACYFSGHRESDDMASAVVTMMYRIHGIDSSDVVIRRMEDMAHRVLVDGTGFDTGDVPYMMLMPGYSYLACVPQALRLVASQLIGSYPGERDLFGHLPLGPDYYEVYPTELWAEAARGCIFSGLPLTKNNGRSVEVNDRLLCEEVDDLLPGLCYLTMFSFKHWSDIQGKLGYYPSLKQVLDVPSEWRLSNWLSRVHIRVKPGYLPVPRAPKFDLAHLTFESDGPLLSDYLSSQVSDGFDTVRVGTKNVLETDVSVANPRLRRQCMACAQVVDIVGHKAVCQADVYVGWSPSRKKAWVGGAVHQMDVHITSKWAGLSDQHRDAYVQAYVCDDAILDYVKQYQVYLDASGNHSDVTRFKADYFGNFRTLYLSRVFPDSYSRVLRIWHPPELKREE